MNMVVWLVEWGPQGSLAVVAYEHELDARNEEDSLKRQGYTVFVREIPVLKFYHGDTYEQANAKLIAAAPDLVGALQWLLDDLCDAGEDKNAHGEYYDSVAHARAALAKAKGTA